MLDKGKLAILFTNYGPYHLARLKSSYELFKNENWEIQALELSRTETDYGWQTNLEKFQIPIISIFGNSCYQKKNKLHIFMQVQSVLSKLKPDVLAIAGYSEVAMVSALLWSISNRKVSIILSDSKEDDTSRNCWKEWIKKLMLRGYQSALVAGKPHKKYFMKLGMRDDSLFSGYDVVGNDDFHPDKIRTLSPPHQKPYFLAINRFIPKKNIFNLLDAYASYRQVLGTNAWDLILCGDGELRSQIEKKILELNLRDVVHLPGFLQQKQLLPYFAHANFFIQASTQDQWGLVVNEAMAAGLPVLVSKNCGCYEDLVIEGVNGFGFYPENREDLTRLMVKAHSDEIDIRKMGAASLAHIQNFSPEQFALSLKKSVDYAIAKNY
ncbi:glycosyltransferase family 4 protein [Brunnivagina elsteri]|uniref:Hexosyltransferase n=1 Tax=Brunnivagina elsteri CCALA 953 TaxID=987040 RepID=A0A2A2THQ5_9CYAN|nr:glycosyltransferase family 4 protein [Calothrix elsteri]PAX53165.1 hexosyltransferase [Calothrix elsteri CCALA 953]